MEKRKKSKISSIVSSTVNILNAQQQLYGNLASMMIEQEKKQNEEMTEKLNGQINTFLENIDKY